MPEQARSAARARPLSPHMQIYRWPVTMATSIVHRATGMALSAGTLLVAWWLIAMVMGDAQYDLFSRIGRSPIGQLVLLGFVWSLAYHLLNGIRHLAWDLGYGFEKHTATRSGILVFTLSVFVTIGVFVYAYAARGVHL